MIMCSSSSVVFSLGLLVSSTNKTDRHDITEILLKNALTTIKPNQTKPNQSPHEIAWQIQSPITGDFMNILPISN
jgi:hypothetical protein